MLKHENKGKRGNRQVLVPMKLRTLKKNPRKKVRVAPHPWKCERSESGRLLPPVSVVKEDATPKSLRGKHVERNPFVKE